MLKNNFEKKIGLTAVFLLITVNLFAFGARVDHFLKPQVGIWFGPVTPILSTAELVDISLGGGAFYRHNLPVHSLKLGLDTSYQQFGSDGVNELTFVPVYGSLLYLLPLDFPVRFQLKAGFGGAWIHIEPDDVSQWDPMYMLGIEISFPAGRRFNIALRLDYNCIYEKHISGAGRNGHIFTTGISVYMNL